MSGARRSHAWRRRALLAGLLAGSVAVLGRAFQVQVVEGDRWLARAEDQHRERIVLPAARGAILDRNGVPLAVSREAYRVAVAPRELRDPEAAASRIRSVLGVSAGAARRAVDVRRSWVVLPGLHDAAARQELAGVRGIHFEPVFERLYVHGSLAAALLGRVNAEGRALGGVELALDSLLVGRPGVAVARRTGLGAVVPGSVVPVVEPVRGHDVYLTIDHGLQEIADGALRRAIAETGARGGDLVLADPWTGEILAAASVGGAPGSWPAATAPYEPGSTIKPFIVAALLAEGRASLGDSIYAEDGRWLDGGRPLTDVHGYGWLTLGDALRYSSNIAVAKAASRLTAEAEYVYLRDFGFGSPTGVAYPSEASGRLRRPADWSAYSQSSLAIGYEISVTSLQMVMAYGALANGGILMEPRLVREVRAWDGRLVARPASQAIRRVVDKATAQAIGATLADVVETGTGREAGLGYFQVAGKTGTAKQFRGGRYEAGSYTASFAGFFPADEPQLSFLVRLDRPEGEYYGGQAAAPVMRATLAAALAAPGTALDRRVVAAAAAAAAARDTADAARGAAVVVAGVSAGIGARIGEAVGAGVGARVDAGAAAPRAPRRGPYILALHAAGSDAHGTAAGVELRVPDVSGLPLRDAVRRLHGLGFRVLVEGGGAVRGVRPAPGEPVPAGAVIRLRGSEVSG